MVQRHAVLAAIYGFGAIGVWFYPRRPGGDRRALKPLTLVLILLAVQGVVGYVQWELELPTEIVWVDVALATLNWLAMLWTIAAAGRLEPAGSRPRPLAEALDRPARRPPARPAATGSGASAASRAT